MRVSIQMGLMLLACAATGLAGCDNADTAVGGAVSEGTNTDASVSADTGAAAADGQNAADGELTDASVLEDSVALEDSTDDATDDAAPGDAPLGHKDGKGGKYDGFGGFDGKGFPDGFAGFDGKGGKGDGFGGFDGKGFGGDATGPVQTACTSAADCTGKCGANATAGCTCAANATGALTCHPACATDADCPTVKLPNGAVFTCTGGACVVTP